MALANYSDLTAAIVGYLRRYDMTTQIPLFISLAEANMNRILRTSRQLVVADYLIDAEFVDLPPDCRMIRTLRLVSGTFRLLQQITPEQMAKQKAIPAVIAMEPWKYTAGDSQLEFWPIPAAPYPAKIEYQLKIPPLDSAHPTNWVIVEHPDVYLWGALAAAYAFLKNDERAGAFQGQFIRVMGEMQASLRTSYDRTLRVDAGMQSRRSHTFNWISGDTF